MDFTKVDQLIEQYLPEMECDLKTLIDIPSVEAPAAGEGAPFGTDVQKALKEALTISEKLGLSTCDLDGYCGYADLAGKTEEQVGVLGHLDVVPADPADWSHPPYCCETVDNRIYGRGTLDDKGPMIAALYGTKALVDAGIPMNKTVRFIFGCNEETGMACMEHYLKCCPPPSCGFTPDAEWPLIVGEKGIMHHEFTANWDAAKDGARLVRLTCGAAANVIPAKAEAVLLDYSGELPDADGITVSCSGNETVISALGTAAHASTPADGDNALKKLLCFLSGLSFGPAEAKETVSKLAHLAEDECYGANFGVAGEDELSRTTHAPTVCHFTETGFSLICDMRFRLTDKVEKYLEILSALATREGFTFTDLGHQNPLYLGADHPLAGKLLESYREVTGHMADPIIIGGGTYAKVMPNFLAFGPEPYGLPPRAHQADEFITRDELLSAAKIYARAIARMAE